MVKDWTEERPWGRFKNILDLPQTKVKLIEVYPGKRLSYQSHRQRREAWTVVEGVARVILDEQEHLLNTGDSLNIPMGAKHRLENYSQNKLLVVEVQTGRFFGEDDILRYEDDFGRS